MATRQVGKLTPLQVKRLTEQGKYSDGGNLFLQVRAGGAKYWLFRYEVDKRERYLGIGPNITVGLAEARDRAKLARQQLLDGIDPVDAKHAKDKAAGDVMTFGRAAEAFYAANAAGWRNAKHRAQFLSTLKEYAYPVLKDMPVADVTAPMVLRVLTPIWTTKTETANRVRGRIEKVLDWAKVQEYRSGDNPAAWRGHLSLSLPKPSKVAKKGHHAALPYAEVAAFMADLRARPGTGARALEFLILTAARTGEALGATWGEVDFDAAVWTVPGERMKAGREHRVPLSDAAVHLLRALPKGAASAPIFVGTNKRPLSNMACLAVLKRMGRVDITAHGFRSTFRDWCAEVTSYPAFVAEMALAHAIGDKVEAAYRRGELLEKRAAMMSDWAAWCSTVRTPADVVPIRSQNLVAAT